MGYESISKKVFEILVKHLVDIEEKRGQLLDKYYPGFTKEREAFEDLLGAYINKIENVINNANVVDDAADLCPFTIIGSIVELENLGSCEIEKYQIVSPFESSSYSEIDFASILSPLGKALLLKEAKDVIALDNSMGQHNYIINSISMPDEILSYIEKEG